MPLASIYNSVKRQPVVARTIQQVIQENPEKRTMFSNSDIVTGKNYSATSTVPRSNSTSVRSIAGGLESSSKAISFVPEEEKTWQQCKSRKEKSRMHFCQKFLMKCVMDKCPKKFIEIEQVSSPQLQAQP